jgi:hypothetical protein
MIIGGGDRSMHPMYWKGTPMNNIYLELKKDGETYLTSQVEEYRNLSTSLAMELIPNFLKQVDEVVGQRTMAIKMQKGGMDKFRESVALELLPKFKSDFKEEAKKRISGTKTTETPKEPTTTPTTNEPTKKEVSDTKPKSDDDKMILYGGIALVVIALIMSK